MARRTGRATCQPVAVRSGLLGVAAVLLVLPGFAWSGGQSAIDLFRGGDLRGWVVEGPSSRPEGDETRPIWTIRNGIVYCAGYGFGFLRYDHELGDFRLQLEFRMSKGCNSGIGIRGTKFTGERGTRPSLAGYEIQIRDDAGTAPTAHSSLSLYRYLAPTENAIRPANEWNSIEITCRGSRIRVVLNGRAVHDIDQRDFDAMKDKPLRGYVSLQNHGRPIEFRNVRLEELAGADTSSS